MTAQLAPRRAQVDASGWLHRITFANEPVARVAPAKATPVAEPAIVVPVVAPSRARSLNGTSDYARKQAELRDSDVGPERVKAQRQALNLTQYETANLIGVSRPVVALAEHAPLGTRCGTRRKVWHGLMEICRRTGKPVVASEAVK